MEDDHIFAAKCQAGDTAAFGTLYDRYIERIYRFIYYKTFSREVAEDLTSDVFMKALQKIHSFDDERGAFSAWLYRIARNAVIDHYRTKKTTVPIEDVFDLSVEDRTIDELDAMAAIERVSEYMKTLTQRQREIITLRIWEGYAYREIAEIVGGTEDSVKMAFSRSIRELREKCGPHALAALLSVGGICSYLSETVRNTYI
jgi:RNA polymerase sigma-70 factor, ECF subfamily